MNDPGHVVAANCYMCKNSNSYLILKPHWASWPERAGPSVSCRISSFIKPQTSQSEHKETPRIKIALYTQLGVGVASKYSDSTICFGQGSASYVTNKACYDEVRSYLPKGLDIQSASKTPCFPKLENTD